MKRSIRWLPSCRVLVDWRPCLAGIEHLTVFVMCTYSQPPRPPFHTHNHLSVCVVLKSSHLTRSEKIHFRIVRNIVLK